MILSELKIGDILVISSERCNLTREHNGWEDNMEQYKGTEQVIKDINLNGNFVMFEGTHGYMWHPHDLEKPKILEDISIAGDKQILDINEIAI